MLASLVFKYFNPVWWAYKAFIWLPLAVMWKLFCLPMNTWNAIKVGAVKAWNRFDSIWAKLAFTSLVVFTLIPGTWTYVFYEAAHYLGYGEEADWLVQTTIYLFKAAWFAGTSAFKAAMLFM